MLRATRHNTAKTRNNRPQGRCTAIAEAVDIPVLLYDNPVLTKNPLQPATIAALRRDCPNITGVKESNQDCANLRELLELVGGDDGFSVLTGCELLIHEQYFREELPWYQPGIQDKVIESLRWVTARGYQPVFWGDAFLGNPTPL